MRAKVQAIRKAILKASFSSIKHLQTVWRWRRPQTQEKIEEQAKEQLKEQLQEQLQEQE
jgi:hypothetical protein